ncbi:MAG TPA: hypothetical protein VKA46_38640 [Gemmataceae bacterium]|nr:hypothetical protein [Gemmataceae bacterium]
MLSRPLRGAAVLALLAVASTAHAQAKYSIKEAKTELPKELKPAVAKLLDDNAVQLLDGKDTLICEVWFRKEVPVKATPEQVKNGITLREIPETTLLGALRVHKTMTDYRKQKIKAGVYTLRLAYQPSDGDHMGTAPNNEFCLPVLADDDKDAELMKPKALHETSAKVAGGSHPAVLLLFPPKAQAPDTPKLEKDAMSDWILTRPVEVKAGDAKATIGLMLTLVGVSSAA